MVQQAQFALETSKGEHAAQVKRVAAMTFGVAHVSAGKGERECPAARPPGRATWRPCSLAVLTCCGTRSAQAVCSASVP